MKKEGFDPLSLLTHITAPVPFTADTTRAVISKEHDKDTNKVSTKASEIQKSFLI